MPLTTNSLFVSQYSGPDSPSDPNLYTLGEMAIVAGVPQSASATLTHAQIMDGTAVELIAAPGAGQVAFCGAMAGVPDVAVFFKWFADYTVDALNLPRLVFYYDSASSLSPRYKNLSDLLTGWGEDVFWHLSPEDLVTPSSWQDSLTNVVNARIMVRVENQPTGGGDIRNTLTISTAFRTVTVPT